MPHAKLNQIAFGAVVLLGIGAAPLANAQAYTFTLLDTLGGGYATGINNAGQVVGVSLGMPNHQPAATIWNGTTASDLGTLGGAYGYAAGINDVGQVAGFSTPRALNGNRRATLWNPGITDLGTLGGTYSFGFAINNTGQVAGLAYLTGNTVYHASVWNTTGGTVTDIDPSGTFSEAHAINNVGQVAGQSYVAGNTAYHATFWDAGSTTFTDLGTLGGTNSSARDINDAGLVVGFSGHAGDRQGHATLWDTNTNEIIDLAPSDWSSFAFAIGEDSQVVGQSCNTVGCGEAAFHATLWKGDTEIDLNTVLGNDKDGWTLQTAYGINDREQIVGQALKGGNTSAFLLTFCDSCSVFVPPPPPPIPEPSTYALLLAGLGLLGYVARRKNREAKPSG